MDAIAAVLELWRCLCHVWCLRLWRRRLRLDEDEPLVDAADEEVDQDDRELSLWRRRLRRGGDTSDSDAVLLARLWLLCE